MPASTVVQIAASCFGIIGSMFFGIGVMRQTVAAMADLSGSYFNWNPHMVPALAAQKADYIFGGCIIVLAFALQLVALLIPPDNTIGSTHWTNTVPWISTIGTAILFFLLRMVAKKVSNIFEVQILTRLKEKDAELMKKLEEDRRAASQK